ncbi:unnamed protein product [Cylicocyclus nassatus]|uniref:Uncharacterized protein n=1 Tax=Cylicocyclus nassatus TaxID=53992 RepID=A0AA36MCV7_CYLNA|nr:unnamed protein product [Cylicocyclus nassatus]
MRGLIIIFAVITTASSLCKDGDVEYEKDQKWIEGSFVRQCQEVDDGSQKGWRIDLLACLTIFYQEVGEYHYTRNENI